MMKKSSCFILLLLFSLIGAAQSDLVEWMNKYVDPISEMYSTTSSEDLRFLDKIADRAIIGLGEACHGNRDFANIQFRFVQYLVNKHNFKVIILENDYFVAEQINRYVSSDMEFDHLNGMKVLRVSVEYYRLYRWIKDYNKDKLPSEKVKVYGMDTWGNVALSQVKALFAANNIIDKQMFNDTFAKIELILRNNSGNKRGKILGDLKKRCEELKNNLRKDAHAEQWYADLIYQTNSADFYRRKSGSHVWQPKREAYMFNNVKNIFKIENSAKTIIIAHNGHLNNRNLWLGKDLKDLYGEKYFIVGSAFGRGSTYGFNKNNEYIVNILSEPPSSTIGDVMGKCKYPIFFFDFARVQKQSAMHKYINTGNKYMFSGYKSDFESERLVLAKNYDAFLFIRQINAADIW